MDPGHQDEIPQPWKDAGLCDASVGQSFAQSSNGTCQQNWVAEMTVTGQQECVLTVPSIRSECPVGFALMGGYCAYEPVGRLGWEGGGDMRSPLKPTNTIASNIIEAFP